MRRTRRKPRGTVYLLHFDRALHHAQHYIGWTQDLDSRLAAHADGNGARLVEVMAHLGIGYRLARVWLDKRKWFERALKKRKFGRIAVICPICSRLLEDTSNGNKEGSHPSV